MNPTTETQHNGERGSRAPGSTLLELVTRLTGTTETEEETVETVLAMLDAREVRLTGNFRGCRLRAS
jgi:hypothetical protein